MGFVHLTYMYAGGDLNMPRRRKAERKTMRKINSDTALSLMRGMMWLGVLATVATVLLRVWLTPAERDWDTGLFSANHLVIGVMLTVLAVLCQGHVRLYFKEQRWNSGRRNQKALARWRQAVLRRSS